ncbi:carboxymuconolactone decarboxylase family protein [Nocardia sp. NPDC055053]
MLNNKPPGRRGHALFARDAELNRRPHRGNCNEYDEFGTKPTHTEGKTLPRVPHRRREDAENPEDIAAFDRLESERRVPTPNNYSALANAPAQLDGLLPYAQNLRQAVELGPRLRDLVILVSASGKGNAYLAAHHEQDALAAGFTPDQIAALSDPESQVGLFTDLEMSIIRFGRAIANNEEMTPNMWDDLARHLSPKQLVQLTLTATRYISGNFATRVPGIGLEDEFEHDRIETET